MHTVRSACTIIVFFGVLYGHGVYVSVKYDVKFLPDNIPLRKSMKSHVDLLSLQTMFPPKHFDTTSPIL